MTDIEFTEYVERRKSFYDKLSSFAISPEQVSTGILLNKVFFDKINLEFKEFFERRKNANRLSKLESFTYKSQFNAFDEKILELYNYRGSAIYWFKINFTGKSSNDKILKRFSNIRNRKSGWWSKASKQCGNNTEYLYVGKVERNLHDRFIQHVGLGHKMTSSLKLAHWFSTFEDIELSFHYLKVDPKFIAHLEDIENVIWRRFNPLLGAEPRIK